MESVNEKEKRMDEVKRIDFVEQNELMDLEREILEEER